MSSVKNFCPVYRHEGKRPKKIVKKPAGGAKEKKKQLRAKIEENLAHVKICQISKKPLVLPVSWSLGGKKKNVK